MLEIIYREIADKIDTKYAGGETTGYTFPAGIYKIGDHNMMLHSLIHSEVKIIFTFDDIIL